MLSKLYNVGHPSLQLSTFFDQVLRWAQHSINTTTSMVARPDALLNSAVFMLMMAMQGSGGGALRQHRCSLLLLLPGFSDLGSS